MREQIDNIAFVIQNCNSSQVKLRLIEWFKNSGVVLNGIRRTFYQAEQTISNPGSIVNKIITVLSQITPDVKPTQLGLILASLDQMIEPFGKIFKSDVNVAWLQILKQIKKKTGIDFKEEQVYISPFSGINNIVRLIDNGQTKIFIKIAPKNNSFALMNEGKTLEFFKSDNSCTEIVPHLIASGKERYGHYYIVLSFIDGESGAETKSSAAIINEICKSLARIHSIKTGTRIGPIKGPKEKSWPLWLIKQTEKALNNLESAGLLEKIKKEKESKKIAGQRIRQEVSQYFDQISGILKNAPIALVHNDLEFQNIMFKHGKLVAFIDWENAMVADPAWEFRGMDLSKNVATIEHNRSLLISYIQAAQEIVPGFDKYSFLRRYVALTPLKNLYFANAFLNTNLKWAANFLELFKNDFDRKNNIHKFDSYYNWALQQIELQKT